MFCKRCRYNLKAIESRTCPECGRAFDPQNPKTYRTSAGFQMRTKLAALSVFTVGAITGWVVVNALGAIIDESKWTGYALIGSIYLGAIAVPCLALGFAAVIFLTRSVVLSHRRPLLFVSVALGCVLSLGAGGALVMGEALIGRGGEWIFIIDFIILSPLLIFSAFSMCREVGLLPDIDTGCCHGCGYDLRGNPGKACPECGRDAT